MGWQRTTAPDYSASEDVGKIKEWLRLDHADEDELLKECIGAAALMFEKRFNVYLLTQSWTLWLDRFRPYVDRSRSTWWNGVRQGHYGSVFSSSEVYIQLNKDPVSAVTQINTYDEADSATEFTSTKYRLSNSERPGRIVLTDGNEWPTSNLRDLDAYEIKCTIGYGDVEDIPEDIRIALRSQVFKLYECRMEGEQKLTETANEIMEQYRILNI